jgi:hypothetical protein
MVMAMGNLVLSIVKSGGGGRGYVCPKLPQKEDGGVDIWAREEEKQMMSCRWRRRDAKSREREGQDGDGEPCAWRCWEWQWGKGICLLQAPTESR